MISDYDKYEPSKHERLMVFGAGYAAIFLVTLLFYHSIMLSAACGMLSIFIQPWYCAYKASKRKELLAAQFKDLLYSMAASFASGRQMQHSLSEGYENLLLIYDKDSPLPSELRYMLKGMTRNRENEEDLLTDFARRSHQEDIRNFVDVYKACRITGGDMEKVIASSSQVMMDKIEIEREIKTLTAQKKFEGKVISMMPLAVVLFLNVFSPDYLAVMYETFAGRMVMTLSLGGIVFAYRMIMKLTEVDV